MTDQGPLRSYIKRRLHHQSFPLEKKETLIGENKTLIAKKIKSWFQRRKFRKNKINIVVVQPKKFILFSEIFVTKTNWSKIILLNNNKIDLKKSNLPLFYNRFLYMGGFIGH